MRLLTLCIALIAIAFFLPYAAADPAPLTTVQTGTVSGDLFVGAFQPVAWNNQPVPPGVKEFSQQFTIPAFTNVQWARLYTEVYAAGTDNRAGRATTRLDGNNGGTNESTWTENLAITSSPDSTVYAVNDHCNKVYSDYLTWYDVTSQVTSQNPKVFIKTENIDGSNFDGRVKMVALVIAYNDGDSDQVKYWVNQGHDYQASGASGVTTSFDTTTIPAGFTAAMLKNVALSSKDARYTFNTLTPAGTDPVSPYNFFETNSWDVTSGISTGSASTFGYTNNGGSFKTTMAALTVRYPAQSSQVDLNITAIKFPTDNNFFAHEPNLVNATVKNLGTSAAGPFNVRFRINGVDTTVPVNGLSAGASLDLQVTDTSLHSAGDSVTISVMADAANTVQEITEGNNILDVTKIVVNNGYKGKRFTDGSDITTVKTFDLKGDLVYSAKPDYQSSGQWSSKTITWSNSDLVIPTTATIREARLYVPYNWDQYSIMPDGVSAAFNGGAVNKIASYSDTKGYGSYNIPSGLVVYNVTSQFSATGSNTATITKTSSQGGPSLNGMVLVVIYADNSRTEKLIFLNEEADILKRYLSDTWISPEEATAYAPFTGYAITTANVNNARLITIANSAKPGEGNLIFNGHSWTGVWQGGDDNSLGIDDRSVQEYLSSTGNEAQLKAGVTGDYFMVSNAILIVEIKNSQPAAPVAVFNVTPSSGTAPLNVVFTDVSTGSISSWAWDFNNDGIVDSTVQNPTHTYSTAGTYTVELTVTGPGGSDSMVKTNLITTSSPSETPTLSFVPTSASFPSQSTRDYQLMINALPNGIEGYDLVVTLTNPAIGKIVNVVYPSWAGMSNTSALPSSSVRMSGVDVNRLVQPGATNVTLGTITLQGDLGGTSPIVISNVNMDADNGEAIIPGIIDGQAIVTSTISADFTATPTSGTVPLNVQFTDQSTGTVTTYAWDFNNDGVIDSTAKNPAYSYSTAGTYSVNLTVTGPGGVNSKIRTNCITVTTPSAAPIANFMATPTTGNVPLSVQFTDQSTGTVTSYAWDFNNDGVVDSTAKNPGYTYGKVGTYTVKLTVQGPGGSDTEKKTDYITVNTPTTPTFFADFTVSPTSGTAPLTVKCIDQSIGKPYMYVYDFGDGVNETGPNPVHTYQYPGVYSITLTILKHNTTSNSIMANSTTKTNVITVTRVPQIPLVANFVASPVSGIAPLTVTFSDQSIGDPNFWNYDFGDGVNATGKNQVHTYRHPGVYNVTLIVLKNDPVTGSRMYDTYVKNGLIVVNRG
jgi:PKD repeat protein